jgi:hypothetical protein
VKVLQCETLYQTMVKRFKRVVERDTRRGRDLQKSIISPTGGGIRHKKCLALLCLVLLPLKHMPHVFETRKLTWTQL